MNIYMCLRILVPRHLSYLNKPLACVAFATAWSAATWRLVTRIKPNTVEYYHAITMITNQ